MANVMNLFVNNAVSVQSTLGVYPLEVAHLEHAEPVALRLHPSAICYTLISKLFYTLYNGLVKRTRKRKTNVSFWHNRT